MKQETGMTLLIAILVMAGIALISLALGAFAIQEIKASRAVALTEPAIAAAESAGEQGLWIIKRNRGSLPICNPGNPPEKKQLSDSSSPWIETCQSYGEATFDLTVGDPLEFFLYHAADVNGNLCMNTQHDNGTHTGCGTNDAIITNLSFNKTAGANSVRVTVSTLDDKSIPTFEAPRIFTDTLDIPIPDPILLSSDERLKVKLEALTTNATVKVNAPPQGMPTFPTVNTIGCSSNTAVSDCNSASQEIYSRRINITVPQ